MEQHERFCPECEVFGPYHIEHRMEMLQVRGESITVPARVAVCRNCRQDIGDENLDDETLQRAYDVYRERHGILTPAQIRELRETLNVGQRAFGRLLGWGDITANRYETGAVPDKAHNAQLIALQDEDALFRFVQRRWSLLNPADQKRVRAAMSRRLPAVAAAEIHHGLAHLMNAHPAEMRGNREFDLHRLGQMVVYFTSQAVKPTRVKLVKLLWYADFLMFKRSRCSISGTAYIHLHLGPVPVEHERLLGEFRGAALVSSETRDYLTADGVRQGYAYQALISFNESLFLPKELDVLAAVHKRFELCGAAQMSEISHREQAWLRTADQELISYTRFAPVLSLE